jgi:hypothetical protein
LFYKRELDERGWEVIHWLVEFIPEAKVSDERR